MNRAIAALAGLGVVLALALAGCGSGSRAYGPDERPAPAASTGASGGGGSQRGYGYAPPQAGPGDGVVAVATVAGVGRVLVDSEGFALYYFERDEGGESSCDDACAAVWPPLRTGRPPRPRGGAVDAAKLGVSERADGKNQVTYAGRPLYTYAADAAPGEANGADLESFGAAWRLLRPDGSRVGG